MAATRPLGSVAGWDADADPRLLYESPFTDMDPMGVAGLFGDEAAAIIDILADMRRRAAA